MKKPQKFIKELDITNELMEYDLNVENEEFLIHPVFFKDSYSRKVISVNLSDSSCLYYEEKKGLLNEPPFLYILNDKEVGFSIQRHFLIKLNDLNKNKNFQNEIIPKVLQAMYKKIINSI